jgi:hypothetical protein
VAYERVERKGAKQLHDIREDLEQIVDGYDAMMHQLCNNRNTKVITIETDNKSIEEVCQRAGGYLSDIIQSTEGGFIDEMQQLSGEEILPEGSSTRQRIYDLLSLGSLKRRLAQWYEEGKIDAFDGADVNASLDKGKVEYILKNFALFLTLGFLTPPGIGSLISCPGRFLWTLGNRAYWTAKRNKDKARVHGLDVAFLSAVPMIGGYAHSLSLYRENPKLYSLVKEHCYENFVSPRLKRFRIKRRDKS